MFYTQTHTDHCKNITSLAEVINDCKWSGKWRSVWRRKPGGKCYHIFWSFRFLRLPYTRPAFTGRPLDAACVSGRDKN